MCSASRKPRLHVGREGGDLCGDGFVEDFDSPGHGCLYLNFEIKKRGKPKLVCVRPQSDAIRRPRDTPIWKLEAALKCRSCWKGHYAPPVHMIKLTETREITPYKWVHPDEER
jgi:hypothetical protein